MNYDLKMDDEIDSIIREDDSNSYIFTVEDWKGTHMFPALVLLKLNGDYLNLFLSRISQSNYVHNTNFIPETYQ